MSRAILALSSCLLLAAPSFAYIRLVTNVIGDTSPAPLIRTDNAGIQFQMNSAIAPGLQSSLSGSSVTVISNSSDPQAAIRAAMASWNNAGAKVTFLPLKSTSLGIDPGDNNMVIAVGTTAADLSAVGGPRGALAITSTNYITGGGVLNGVTVEKGTIVDSDIVINPSYSFSTDGSTNADFQNTITHELGHAIGLNHTGLIGGVMYQYVGQRFLTSDETTFLDAVYPGANAQALGKITGTVSLAGSGVPYAMLTAFDVTTGNTIGGVSNADGTFTLIVPVGNYQIYAEPINGVVPYNIYLTADQLALATATKFQSSLAAGTFPVAANASATADINLIGGTTTFHPVYAYVASTVNGAAGAGSATGGFAVPSGGAVDLIFAGTGFDATLTSTNFNVFGKGITVRAGSVRVDKATVSGFNLLRVTLDVGATATPALGSVLVSNATGAISFSGNLEIVPPTPTFVSDGVISAAPYTGIQGGVTPGGIYSIYDIPGAPNLGPANYVLNGPFDAYGNLATTLGGVSVTFDGVPAPMFLSAASQLNFQVPFELATKTSSKVVVNYLGSSSAPVTVPVLKVQPSFFTSCNGVCAYNLADATVNSADHPAPRGSYIEVYGTGIGAVSYPIATGHGAPALPQGFTGNYTYSIGGSAVAPALFGGYTPNLVGLAQWDLQVPATSATGAVPISVTDASGVSSPTGMTIFVK